MGRAIIEVVRLSREGSDAEGILMGVADSFDEVTTSTATSGAARKSLGNQGNAVVVTALTGMVQFQIMDSASVFEAAKSKTVLVGQSIAQFYTGGQVLSIRELT